jgi:hypothetical protein
LADDFVCSNPGPITDIHLWGSWLNDQVQTNSLTFWLVIYSNVPVSATNSFSYPGNLLWQEQFGPGQYIESFWSFGQESFLDPGASAVVGPDSQVWYYCFYPTNIFVQQGGAAAPTIYWLMVYAQPPTGGGFQYGWKSTPQVQNDASVHAPWSGMTPTNNPGWTPTQQSPTGGPLDLSFEITTATPPSPPPVVCVETNGLKYEQGPNLIGGYDVYNDPYVLADDFTCSNMAPVSDIHLWGSWLNSQALTNTIIFWLGIYNDVPVNPNNPYSHPGTNLLWQQWFAPGQYAETLWGVGQENFFDPVQMSLSPETNVWYYCFYPTNPFVQQGTAAKPTNYWLAAYAQLPAGIPYEYGWKTTTNVQNDVSVHAPWPGMAPTNNPGWTETLLPTGAPLDLAFKLTTALCGPITITYLATNKVVLTWPSGFLQSSANVIGPYVDVPGATSPYTNVILAPPYTFYRLRCY